MNLLFSTSSIATNGQDFESDSDASVISPSLALNRRMPAIDDWDTAEGCGV
jgi:hypothetical protein